MSKKRKLTWGDLAQGIPTAPDAIQGATAPLDFGYDHLPEYLHRAARAFSTAAASILVTMPRGVALERVLAKLRETRDEALEALVSAQHDAHLADVRSRS